MNTQTIEQPVIWQPQKEVAKPLPKLIKQSTTYKLIVPERVEEEIRYLIRKFPSTEWSGVLFYTHQGTFEGNNLVITCEDIYPMDLGDATFTNFKMSSDVASYIAQNIELFNCDMGLVHSHHSMATFFSGTDQSTLQSEGNDTNCFVSLIVNTEGTYSAAVTRKVKSKKQITVKDLGSSYEFFGEGEVKDNSKVASTTHNERAEEIQYFMLDVERHEVNNPLEFLDKRFDAIKAMKQDKDITSMPFSGSYNRRETESKDAFYDISHPWESRKQKVQEPYLFDDATMESITDANAAADLWTPDKDLIHRAVCKMISCSMILNVERFDLRQWVTRYMNNVYNKIFTDSSMFNEWLEFAVTYFVYHFVDNSAPKELSDIDYFEDVAFAMAEELEPFNNSDYPYIGKYINELSII